MKFLFTVSLRNLLRQKRRNIFLGSAIAFGVMILVVMNSFSLGITDTLFNRVISYAFGHVNIAVSEGGYSKAVFRDKERMERIIRENAKNYIDFDEGIGLFTRTVGIGTAENMILVGIDTSKKLDEKRRKELDESFHLLDGKFEDLTTYVKDNPLLIPKDKADLLHVKMGDSVNIRFTTIYGQSQTARLKIVGLLSNDNIFMAGVMFTDFRALKEMLGIKPWECSGYQITLKNPREDAAAVADAVHSGFKPGPAFIAGTLSKNGIHAKATAIPFYGDNDSKKLIQSSFTLLSGKMDDVLSNKGAMVSDILARRMGIRVGDKISITYAPRFEKEPAKFDFEVAGIFKSDSNTGSDTVYMQDHLFYPKFYAKIPDLIKDRSSAFLPPSGVPFAKTLGAEFVLLERTKTTAAYEKKIRELSQKTTKVATVDVNSMYEVASQVISLEYALILVSVIMVLILFFVILIGVVNTLRMTIRERTREIGTMRAIGMQRGDVGSIFMMETGLLAFFSSVAGSIAGFILMGILSLIKINSQDNPLGMLLVQQHLFFKPSVVWIVVYIFLIVLISLIAAFVPARRASKLSAAEALRHYE